MIMEGDGTRPTLSETLKVAKVISGEWDRGVTGDERSLLHDINTSPSRIATKKQLCDPKNFSKYYK